MIPKPEKKAPDRLSKAEVVKLVLFCAVVILILRSAWSMANNALGSIQSRQEYTKKLDSLEDQKVFLKKTLDQMNTDDGREAYIRKELRVVKPGEQIFIVEEAKTE